MRKRLALLLLLASWGCATEDAPAADVCAQAMNVFTKCGVTLPLLSEGACIGTARAVARCVANHANTCEELASLTQRIDACVADELDGGEILPPAEDLPLPAPDGTDAGHAAAGDAAGTPKSDDAGTDATMAADGGVDASRDAATDSALPVADAALPDAALADANAGPWTLDFSGSIASTVEKRFVTPTLPPGTYTFTMTGTGDADLYARKTAAPTTRSYDCRPFLNGSDESCAVTLATPDVIQVMVRGVATQSTFTLQGR